MIFSKRVETEKSNVLLVLTALILPKGEKWSDSLLPDLWHWLSTPPSRRLPGGPGADQGEPAASPLAPYTPYTDTCPADLIRAARNADAHFGEIPHSVQQSLVRNPRGGSCSSYSQSIKAQRVAILTYFEETFGLLFLGSYLFVERYPVKKLSASLKRSYLIPSPVKEDSCLKELPCFVRFFSGCRAGAASALDYFSQAAAGREYS